MIEKDECPRAILRSRFAISTTCGVCRPSSSNDDPGAICRRVYKLNDPVACRGASLVPPKGLDASRDMEAKAWNYERVECPHDSPEACPWWEERAEHRRRELAGHLEWMGFPRSNRHPEAELLPADIAESVLRYVRDHRRTRKKPNVVIAGPVGAGKTTVAAYLVGELGGRARLVTAVDLFDGLRHEVPEGLRSDRILVVDDLGTEIASPVALLNWHRVVDERYNEGLATIVTTNAEDVDSLFQDERTRSRFMARCEVWRTTRKDVRRWMEEREEKARREADVNAGNGEDG